MDVISSSFGLSRWNKTEMDMLLWQRRIGFIYGFHDRPKPDMLVILGVWKIGKFDLDTES